MFNKTKPKTRIEEVKDVLHGVEIIDPYRWLENGNSLEVKQWTEKQNKYSRDFLDSIKGREQLKKQFKELYDTGSIGSLHPKKGRYFFSKRTAGQNHPVLYYRDGLESESTVAIDPNTFSEDGTKALDWYHPTPDGKLIAYGVSAEGNEDSILHIIDVDNNKLLDEKIPRTRHADVAWLNDNSGFYYTKYPDVGSVPEEEERYHRHVFFHKLGTDPKNDKKIFGDECNKEDLPIVSISPDGKYLLIHVWHGWSKNEIYYKDLSKEGSTFERLIRNMDKVFRGKIRGDTAYVLTNHKAPRLRLIGIDLNRPEEENWKVIIPESESTLESFDIVGDKIITQYLRNASSSLSVYSIEGKFLREINLPVLGWVSECDGEWNGNELFFSYESFFVPPTIYRCDLKKNELKEVERLKTNLNFNDLEVKQVWYESKDKTKVSMFIMHKKDIGLDEKNPTLLTGYGGFGINLTPVFIESIRPFLQRGGVFVYPNLRGGGEYGEEWHRAGMLENKQNVFDDFIAASEWLIKNKYTDRKHLAIYGGSNGGLLVGAALTQHPDLYKAVICEVPLLDMIRYHKFLIARLWIPEYGCADNEKDFGYLIKYSPYHNVKQGEKYPAVLFTTAESDTRVDPMHARKMTALLQKANASENPILLKIETKAGHGIGKPMNKVLENTTDRWSFLYQQLGLDLSDSTKTVYKSKKKEKGPKT